MEMIKVIKFTPEKHWLYRPKVWLANVLWRCACRVHPCPPKFQEEISDEYISSTNEAKEFLKNITQSCYRANGITFSEDKN